MGFDIFFLVCIKLLVFGTHMFQIWAHYLDFEGAKNIHVLQVLIRGFRGHWKFLIGVLHANIDSDMVTGLWFTRILNFGFLSWFLRCKEHQCP